MDVVEQDAERILRLSHATIENSADGMFWLDSEGRICRVNKTMREVFGYTEEEFLSLRIHDIDLDYIDGDFWIHWQRARELGRPDRFEERMLTRDGRVFPADITVNFIEFEGKEYGCTTIRDITLQKQREKELRQALSELERLKRRLEEENVYLQEEIKVDHNFGTIIGSGKEFKQVLKQVEVVAPTDTTVLILGETGTGKELLARALHDLSDRSQRALVKVNCAALPANLIESELFGHEKGAFTGAISRKVGRFELANGGTIFLDEIGDLPLELQAKLLRVLQEGEFERVGGTATVKVDVRVIAATNRDLDRAVDEDKFREDLFYRLNVFPLNNPPLRDRREDIPTLVSHFVQKYSSKMGKAIDTVPKKVMDSLRAYHWPGNVRELENIIERSVILSPDNTLVMMDCFRKPGNGNGNGNRKNELVSLEEVERHHISDILEKTGWRVRGERGAAEILGLKATTLEARMKKLGIERKRA